jgi:hypothetical protein
VVCLLLHCSAVTMQTEMTSEVMLCKLFAVYSVA